MTLENQIALNGDQWEVTGKSDSLLFSFTEEHLENIDAGRLILFIDGEPILNKTLFANLNGSTSIVKKLQGDMYYAHFEPRHIKTDNEIFLESIDGTAYVVVAAEFHIKKPESEDTTETVQVPDMDAYQKQLGETVGFLLEGLQMLTRIDVPSKDLPLLVKSNSKVVPFSDPQAVIIDEIDYPDPPPSNLPKYPWFQMGGYNGTPTQDGWLSADSLSSSVGMQLVNTRTRKYLTVAKNPEILLDPILTQDLRDDIQKGRYQHTHVDLTQTTPEKYLYRAQTSYPFDWHHNTVRARGQVFDRAFLDSIGWDDWYVGQQDELVQSWSIRFPEEQNLNIPPTSVKGGWDWPGTSLQVWQNRTRFNGPYAPNTEEGKGNVPIAIYWNGDHLRVKNEWDMRKLIDGGEHQCKHPDCHTSWKMA